MPEARHSGSGRSRPRSYSTISTKKGFKKSHLSFPLSSKSATLLGMIRTGPSQTGQSRKLFSFYRIVRRHYRILGWIILALDVLVALGYLIVVGHHMNNRIFYIPFPRFLKWFSHNSYSLITPFMTLGIVLLMLYNIRYRKKLNDGDFMGVLGVILLLALTDLFDATQLAFDYKDMNGAWIGNKISSSGHDVKDLFKAFKTQVVEAGRVTETLDYIQITLQCCGAWKGPAEDWKKINDDTGGSIAQLKNGTMVPSSCCCPVGLTSVACNAEFPSCPPHSVQRTRCIEPLFRLITTAYRDTMIVMYVLAFFLMITILFHILHWIILQEEGYGDNMDQGLSLMQITSNIFNNKVGPVIITSLEDDDDDEGNEDEGDGSRSKGQGQRHNSDHHHSSRTSIPNYPNKDNETSPSHEELLPPKKTHTTNLFNFFSSSRGRGGGNQSSSPQPKITSIVEKAAQDKSKEVQGNSVSLGQESQGQEPPPPEEGSSGGGGTTTTKRGSKDRRGSGGSGGSGENPTSSGGGHRGTRHSK